MLHGWGCLFGAGGTAGQGRQAASGAMSGGGFHRPRMIFVSIVARACRKPFQQRNLDRKGTLSRGIPSSTNDLRFHRGPIMYVGGHSSGGTSTGRVPCREGFHRPRIVFVLSSLPPCAHVRIYTYIYIFLAASFGKITFSKISKCCVFDISTRTFSDRYQLMETMFCVFLFSLLFLPVPMSVYIHIYIYIL